MDTIAFVSEKKDYGIAEFHDRFHSSLPKVVEVNQGICSDTGEETFGKGEVLVIAAIARQRRVIAELQINQKPRLISIPETYEKKLCVVNKGTPSREDTLINILGHNKLPITVCFPRNRTISVGQNRISTNNIPHLQLTETFDEVSLLGNYINDGELCKDYVHVPLYLSKLRVSIVTSIKGQSINKWKQYKRDLNHKCSLIQYDREFNNQDIAEYDPSVVHSGKALTYLEPMTYENIVNLVQTNDTQSFFPDLTPEEIDEIGLYEDVQVPAHVVQCTDTYYNQPENRNPLKKSLAKSHHTPRQPTEATSFAQQLQSSIQKLKPTSQTARCPPPIAPKPVFQPNTQGPTTKVEKELAPALPARQSSYYQKAKPKHSVVPEHNYTNLIPRSSVAPTVSVKSKGTKSPSQNIKSPDNTDWKSHQTICREVNSKDDVAKLSVKDVCEYLKLLNLSQYEHHFREHLIDGALLQSLDTDVCINEIGMKQLEVIRLMKFSKEGRLPIRS